jgi:GDP-mannose transporter
VTHSCALGGPGALSARLRVGNAPILRVRGAARQRARRSAPQASPLLRPLLTALFPAAQVLQHANVETFIVFRSITPLIVAVADPFFRPHVAQLPSAKTTASLLLIFAGAAGYTTFDSTFSVTSYGWGVAYVVIFCVEMIYVKDVVSHIKLSNWGLVYYNNGIGALMSIVVFLLFDESGAVGRALTPAPVAGSGAATLERRARRMLAAAASAVGGGAKSEGASEWTLAVTGVVVSCVFGLGISFFGFSVRRKISATGFTVMGCTNKLLTLLVNTLAWDRHASAAGQACLLVCIAGGVAYGEFSKADTEARKVLPVRKSGTNAGDAEMGSKPEKARMSEAPTSSA